MCYKHESNIWWAWTRATWDIGVDPLLAKHKETSCFLDERNPEMTLDKEDQHQPPTKIKRRGAHGVDCCSKSILQTSINRQNYFPCRVAVLFTTRRSSHVFRLPRRSSFWERPSASIKHRGIKLREQVRRPLPITQPQWEQDANYSSFGQIREVHSQRMQKQCSANVGPRYNYLRDFRSCTFATLLFKVVLKKLLTLYTNRKLVDLNSELEVLLSSK